MLQDFFHLQGFTRRRFHGHMIMESQIWNLKFEICCGVEHNIYPMALDFCWDSTGCSLLAKRCLWTAKFTNNPKNVLTRQHTHPRGCECVCNGCVVSSLIQVAFSNFLHLSTPCYLRQKVYANKTSSTPMLAVLLLTHYNWDASAHSNFSG